jgi:hypothetical protein
LLKCGFSSTCSKPSAIFRNEFIETIYPTEFTLQ